MLQSRFPPGSQDLRLIGWTELVSVCAHNRDHAVYWTEFLRRYGPKIKIFIRGSWRLSIMGRYPLVDVLLGGVQENDLFQTVIMRLVEQDCAAMKRFSGNSEDGWLAYLAVISRSVVRDAVKYERRRKRPGWTDAVAVENLEDHPLSPHQEAMLPAAMERRILARELRAICDSAIPNLEREASDRNMLIFRLYFDHDLSPAQIAGCNGVNLSRAGVEKVLQRLKEHIRGLVSQASAEAILE